MSRGWQVAGSSTKQIQLLLTPTDEQQLVDLICEDFPEVVFLDERMWTETDVPPARASILDCGSIAAIWNRAIWPTIEGVRRPNGVIDGPSIGPVVQWLRSLERTPGVLSPGRWAASFSERSKPAMRPFVDRIWRILGKQTSNDMVWLDTKTPVKTYHVGRDAERAALDASLVLVGSRRLMPRSAVPDVAS